MAIAAITTRWLLHGGSGLADAFDKSSSNLLIEIVFYFAFVNLLLGLFNLLPIPPLDGSAVLERFIPERHLPTWYRVRPYGLLAVFVIVFWVPGVIDTFLNPFYTALFDFVVK
jgi:Zn-dependent protease